MPFKLCVNGGGFGPETLALVVAKRLNRRKALDRARKPSPALLDRHDVSARGMYLLGSVQRHVSLVRVSGRTRRTLEPLASISKRRDPLTVTNGTPVVEGKGGTSRTETATTLTTSRQPGRPDIEIVRADSSSVRARVTSDGFPARTWFEARVDGFAASSKRPIFLAAGRFSPDQDGAIDWNVRVYVPSKWHGRKIDRLRVVVQRDRFVGPAPPCQGDVTHTCLTIRIPPQAVEGTG